MKNRKPQNKKEHVDSESMPLPHVESVIYSDGACLRGRMGIGVFSETYQIEIARYAGWGTNNEAECRALIAALEEARTRGIKGATFLTDSQLVDGWINLWWNIQSATGAEYVPVIRRLLREVGGTLQWIPGKSNRADALSKRYLSIDDVIRRGKFEYSTFTFDLTDADTIRVFENGQLVCIKQIRHLRHATNFIEKFTEDEDYREEQIKKSQREE